MHTEPAMPCILCSHDELSPRHVLQGFNIKTCRGCGLTQLSPLPDAAALEKLYTEEYYNTATPGVGYDDYAAQEQEYLPTFAEDVERISQFVAQGGKVLDVGCGYGWFVSAALQRGYDAHGLDVSQRAVEIGNARHPGRFHCGSIDEVPALRDQRFDVIFLSHLIEHITEPLGFLKSLAAHLTERGILVMVTPNISSLLSRVSGKRWVSFKLPEHVAYYHPGTIRRLYEQAGMRVVAVDSAYQHYRLPFVAQKLRKLLHPVSRLVPSVESLPIVRDQVVRITSGSLRAIGKRDLS